MFDLKEFLGSGTVIAFERGKLLLGFGKRTWFDTPVRGAAPNFYFPDFFLREKRPWFQHEYTKTLSYDQFLSLPFSNPATRSLAWASPSFESYEWGFESLQKLFQQGRLEKGVPYVFETTSVSMERSQLERSLRGLIEFAQKRAIFPYGFWDEKSGILGASPELLFKIQSGKLETMACAGTMGHHESIDSFINDPKEREEHHAVVQGITESLKSFGHVACGKLQILDLGALVHLVTPIEMSFSTNPDYKAMIQALHPTPALGTFPKKAGEAWLAGYDERVPRKRYGAPVGVVDERGGRFYVGIRNVQWDAGGMALGAGGGVNRQSEIKKEWAEIHRKLGAIKEVLSLA